MKRDVMSVRLWLPRTEVLGVWVPETLSGLVRRHVCIR